MRSIPHAVAVVLLLVLSLGVGSAMGRPIHVLPLGDSITQGGRNDREEYTYRYPLFGMLKETHIDFDFIGSLTVGLHADAKWPDYKGRPFDPHHEGHYGWKTAAVQQKLAEWMKSYPAPADVVLIHLGTNDLSSKTPEKDVIEPLKAIIALLRGANPRVIVLVGHLDFDEGKEAAALRELVEAMAKELSTDESPVVTVHHYKGWVAKPDIPGADTFDWAHPNPLGQTKMARNWFEAMRPFFPRLMGETGQLPSATQPAGAKAAQAGPATRPAGK